MMLIDVSPNRMIETSENYWNVPIQVLERSAKHSNPGRDDRVHPRVSRLLPWAAFCLEAKRFLHVHVLEFRRGVTTGKSAASLS